MFRDMSISNTTMDEFRQHIQTTSVRQRDTQWNKNMKAKKHEASHKEKNKTKLNVHLVTLVCKQVWTNTTFQTLRKAFFFFRLLPLRNPFVAWTSQSESSLQATGLHSRQHLNATSLLLQDSPLKSLEGKDLLFFSSASASSSSADPQLAPVHPTLHLHVHLQMCGL